MTIPIVDNTAFWQDIVTKPQYIDLFKAALQNSAKGLSEMIGQPIWIETPQAESIPIPKIIDCVGGPETEMVGIYLLIEGDLTGQVVLMMTFDEAARLVDLLLDEPTGTTHEFGELEQSALAETGNITTAFFLNEIAALTGTELRPSPPAVMVNMLGAIVDVITTPIAAFSDDLVIVETAFHEENRTIKAHFWLLPLPEYGL